MVVRSSGERRPVAEDDRLAVSRGSDGTLVVRLAGAWSLESGLPAMGPVEEALVADPPPRAVTFDTQALEHWDSGDYRMTENGGCIKHPLVSGARLRDIATDMETQHVAIGSREPDAAPVGDDHEPHVRALFNA